MDEQRYWGDRSRTHPAWDAEPEQADEEAEDSDPLAPTDEADGDDEDAARDDPLERERLADLDVRDELDFWDELHQRDIWDELRRLDDWDAPYTGDVLAEMARFAALDALFDCAEDDAETDSPEDLDDLDDADLDDADLDDLMDNIEDWDALDEWEDWEEWDGLTDQRLPRTFTPPAKPGDSERLPG